MAPIQNACQLAGSLILLLIALILSGEGCHHSTQPTPPPKDPRTYSWTMDTIIATGNLSGAGELQTEIMGVWGSSATDVYAVGGNSGTQESIFHFDGTRWTQLNPFRNLRTNQRTFQLDAIVGFSSTDIWISGAEFYDNPSPPPNFLDSSAVFHFDGAVWSRPNLPGREAGLTARIWGDRPDNIWITGNRAIWHFDGTVWNKDSLPLPSMPINIGETPIAALIQTADRSLWCTANGADGTSYYLLKKTTSWSVLDSTTFAGTSWGCVGLYISPEGSLYSYGNGVYEKVGPTSWSRLFGPQLFGNINPISAVCGRDQDLFAAGVYGMILYYDGNNTLETHQFENTSTACTSIWRSGDQVFIGGYIAGSGTQITGFVIHGK